jgi:hypothetical protein
MKTFDVRVSQHAMIGLGRSEGKSDATESGAELRLSIRFQPDKVIQ